MYFTSGSDRAFEQLMQTRPGADHFDSGEAGAPEGCGTCRFYRPHWKYQFCVYEECPYQPGKRTALDGAVKFQVKGVDDEMAVFRVEKNRGYTVMSNHHLRNKDLSLKAKGLLSQMEELEARAKAGEQISLLDVAEAAKAEAKKPKQTRKTTQKQKKPSIRAQLAAAKEEQKKKPPAREKSKEMEV